MAGRVRGQIMTRPMHDDPENKGHVRVIVYGILSLPKSSFLNKEGMQFVVSENQIANLFGTSENVDLTLYKDGAIDRSEMAKGKQPSQMLCEGIWRT